MDTKNITISIDIAEHWLWKDKPFSKGQAFIDLLIQAKLLEGELITTEQYLMDRWGWSKSKLRLYLSKLEKELKINRRKDQKKTSISIVNYSVYIDIADQKRTIEKTEKRPNENINIISEAAAEAYENEKQLEIQENEQVENNAMAAQANMFLSLVNK